MMRENEGGESMGSEIMEEKMMELEGMERRKEIKEEVMVRLNDDIRKIIRF